MLIPQSRLCVLPACVVAKVYFINGSLRGGSIGFSCFSSPAFIFSKHRICISFAEIIPQSLFTRHGLYLGAKMAGFTKVLIYVMVHFLAPFIHLLFMYVSGSYRLACRQTARVCSRRTPWYYLQAGRFVSLSVCKDSLPRSKMDSSELKELIAMHSSHATHGGDLKIDTVTIIGATLDLQEKVVKQVCFFTPPSQ